MLQDISNWYNNKFATKDAAVFLIILISGVLIINFFGEMLAPILASIVIAFLLESIVNVLCKYTKISRIFSVIIVYLIFLAAVVAVVVVLIPLLVHQFAELVKTAPAAIASLKESFAHLAVKYPSVINPDQVNQIFSTLSSVRIEKLATIGTYILKFSLSSLPTLFTILIYFFLVPLLVFFFMKDKSTIINWTLNSLPKEKGGLQEVWLDLRPQLANYVKGKAAEMVIMTIVTYIGLAVFHMNYALLLAVCVGLSVMIPYIGMVIVTIPVMIIGLMQFGFTSTFAYMFIIYLILQALDGNLLVPLLYSEAVSLHPVAVIASVLIFGGIWGFWGLFFAIPLAALTKAALNMWTRHSDYKVNTLQT